MVLHEHRSRFERSVAPFAAWCHRHNINPNHLTLLSMAITLVGSVAFYLSSAAVLWPLVAGALLLGIGAILDSADGVLARMTDQASALGDYLDHAMDRFADVALLLGLTFSPWVDVWVGTLAIVGTLLTSYMGTQAQAVGVGRDYGGIMGRADRMALLFTAPLLQVGLEVTGYTLPYGLNMLWLVLAWIAVAGNITAIQRFYGALRELQAQG